MQLFEEWLKLAKHIYSITSFSTAKYQNYNLEEKPSSIVKIITNEQTSWPYDRLEPPNLISDFAANILSFCMHCKTKCTLFIVYADLLPSDNVNTGVLVDILRLINFPDVGLYEVIPVISSGNIYL